MAWKFICPWCGSDRLSWDAGSARCVKCDYRGMYPDRVEIKESEEKERGI